MLLVNCHNRCGHWFTKINRSTSKQTPKLITSTVLTHLDLVIFLCSFSPKLTIPAWITKHMSGKVWDEITYLFLSFNGYTWKCISNFIPRIIRMQLFIHAAIKVNPYMLVKGGPVAWQSFDGFMYANQHTCMGSKMWMHKTNKKKKKRGMPICWVCTWGYPMIISVRSGRLII